MGIVGADETKKVPSDASAGRFGLGAMSALSLHPYSKLPHVVQLAVSLACHPVWRIGARAVSLSLSRPLKSLEGSGRKHRALLCAGILSQTFNDWLKQKY